jgi:hypothetical protein
MFKVAYLDTIARHFCQKWKIIIMQPVKVHRWQSKAEPPVFYTLVDLQGLSRDADSGDELKQAWFTCSCIVISVGYDSLAVL